MATAVEELKAAAGSASLHSPLGKWRMLVSQLVDAINPFGAGAPDYAWVKRANGDQVGVSSGTNINFNVVGSSRGVLPLFGGGVSIVLNQGKRYRLTVFGRFKNYSDATGGNIILKFVDDTNTPLQDGGADSPSGSFRPTTNTVAEQSSAGLEMIFSVPQNATDAQRSVKVRCTGSTGSADVSQGEMTWVVQEIPGGLS